MEFKGDSEAYSALGSNGNGKNGSSNGASNNGNLNGAGNNGLRLNRNTNPYSDNNFEPNTNGGVNGKEITNSHDVVSHNRKATDRLPTGQPPMRRHTTDPLLPENNQDSNHAINPHNTQMVLNGALTAFSPSSILSLLNIQKQTGTLYLAHNNIVGYVYVNNGEVWDAKLGTVIGAYALFQLFGWKQGQFSFEVNNAQTAPKRSIDASLPVLQVRATLWLDSFNKYNRLIPSVSHRIVIANDPPGDVVIESYQWAVLTKIVAKPLSIAELAEELEQDLMTVTRIAADLVRVGVAVVKPPENFSENVGKNGVG